MDRSREALATLSAMIALTGAPTLTETALAQAADPVVEPFVLRGFDGVETPAELIRLTVPANRADSGAGTIDLAFVRLPATGGRPGSPIVFLAGGPGVPGIVMGQVPPYRALFERLRSVADVILLDQRGTGRSTPTRSEEHTSELQSPC